jgi:acyl carrier protein
MDQTTVLLLLDEVIEAAPGTLKGPESIKEWDSIAIISLIALADERFNMSISASQIQNCHTVNDVVTLLLSE